MPDDASHHLIPAFWRATVAAILVSGDSSAIITTQQADREWSAAFPDAWNYQRFEAMAEALALPTYGRQLFDMAEPGEVWSFWFTFSGRKLYCKINLLPGGKIIIVYSSHPPRKGVERL